MLSQTFALWRNGGHVRAGLPPAGTEIRPCLHQERALFDQVTAPIGGLYLVGQAMRQGMLADFTRE